MISHGAVCLQVHGEKSSISNTFCHAKREYSFSVHPIGYTPVFCFCIKYFFDIIWLCVVDFRTDLFDFFLSQFFYYRRVYFAKSLYIFN